MSFMNCTSISPACPLEATTYGYRPAIGPNAVLLAIFGVLAICQLVLVFIHRLWSYSFVIAAGCVLELVGYVGRLMMNPNPWSENGFRIQIICLILAPSLLAAGVYLTLKHLVIYFGPEYSRLRPKLYTWIFIGCDIGSILLQATGGGVAAAAGKDAGKKSLANAGNDIMMAGIAFQVVTMVICGLMAVEFALKVRRAARQPASKEALRAVVGVNPKAMLFCGAVAFAYVTILIRCIYRQVRDLSSKAHGSQELTSNDRLPEMAGGWGGPLMRDEAEFLTLDGLMVVLASAVLTVFYPGYFFPDMLGGKAAVVKPSKSGAGSEDAESSA